MKFLGERVDEICRDISGKICHPRPRRIQSLPVEAGWVTNYNFNTQQEERSNTYFNKYSSDKF